MSEIQSKGHDLYHFYGIRQGAFLKSSFFSEETLNKWICSRPYPEKREINKKNIIPADSLLIVLSQNCDIACPNDSLDLYVELGVFKKIKEKKVYPGNKYVQSARILQLEINNIWYESKFENIIHVKKEELIVFLEENNTKITEELDSINSGCIPVWRANRYNRTALPDFYNLGIKDIFLNALEKLDEIPLCSDNSNYIRALYVKLDKYTEEKIYTFQYFALVKHVATDKIMADIIDILEEMSEQIHESTGFIIAEDAIFAGRDSTTYVGFLGRFLRVNLDYKSLLAGDEDVEPMH